MGSVIVQSKKEKGFFFIFYRFSRLPRFMAGPATMFPMAISATWRMAAWRTPPFFLGCFVARKVSTTAAPRAALATLVPFSPIHDPGWVCTLRAAMAPALTAHRASCSHGIRSTGLGAAARLRDALGGYRLRGLADDDPYDEYRLTARGREGRDAPPPRRPAVVLSAGTRRARPRRPMARESPCRSPRRRRLSRSSAALCGW